MITASTTADNSGTKRLRVYVIFAGQLFDPLSRAFLANQVITIDRDTGVILDVADQATARPLHVLLEHLRKELQSGPNDEDAGRFASDVVEVSHLDLQNNTLIPGLVDVHVHRKLNTLSQRVELTACSFPASLLGNILGRPAHEREPRGEDGSGDSACEEDPTIGFHHRKVGLNSLSCFFICFSSAQ